MGDERPSDAAQPVTKRRAGAQITKDDEDDDEDLGDVDPGEWRPVEGAVGQRRRVKVRRRGEEPEPVVAAPPAADPAEKPPAAAAPVAGASANPFAGISLTAPAAPANPFAGISLMAPGSKTAAEGDKPASTSENKANDAAAAKDAKAEGAKDEAKEGGKDEAKTSTAPAAGFGAVAASAKPFGFASSGGAGGFASVTGTAFGSNTGGFGAFGATASGAPFASGSTPAFSFGTGAFPNIAAAPLGGAGGSHGGAAPSGGGDEDGGDGGEALQVFNSTADFAPVVQLPDQNVVTGEEEETTVLNVDGGALFEYVAADRKWRERGKGEFRINTNKSGMARMVMRAAGNFRLLLNAKVYKNMPVSIMAGNSGVTFACVNATGQGEASDKKDQPASTAGTSAGDKEQDKEKDAARTPGLATWGLRIKAQEKVEAVYQMLLEHAKQAHAGSSGAAVNTAAKNEEAGAV